MRFLKFVGLLVIGSMGLVTMGLLLDEDTNQFEVHRIDNFFRGDGQGLEIVNVAQTPVIIREVQVNERRDCLATIAFAFGSKGGELPMKLNVGDKVTVVSKCRAVRVLIVTDKKSVAYNFKQ